MGDIIINDGFVEKTGAALEAETREIETTLAVYLRLLREISERGIMEGKTAEALRQFISIAEKLTGLFTDFGEGAEMTCRNFIKKMEAADRDLYTGI